MPDLEDPHADVINDLDPTDDLSTAAASQLSPITAVGAPSVHSQGDDDSHSAVTAPGADSIAPKNDDTSQAASPASPIFTCHTLDDLSSSTTHST